MKDVDNIAESNNENWWNTSEGNTAKILPQHEPYEPVHYSIDFEKVTTFNDVILVLKALELTFSHDKKYEFPDKFKPIKHLLKKHE